MKWTLKGSDKIKTSGLTLWTALWHVLLTMLHPTQKQQVVSGMDCAAALVNVMMCSWAHEHLSHVPNTDTLFSLAEGDTGAFIWTQTKQIAQQQGKCATTSISVWSWHTDRRNGTVGCWSKVQFAVWNRPLHYCNCNLVATKSCVDYSDGDGWNWLRIDWISGPTDV